MHTCASTCMRKTALRAAHAAKRAEPDIWRARQSGRNAAGVRNWAVGRQENLKSIFAKLIYHTFVQFCCSERSGPGCSIAAVEVKSADAQHHAALGQAFPHNISCLNTRPPGFGLHPCLGKKTQTKQRTPRF